MNQQDAQQLIEILNSVPLQRADQYPQIIYPLQQKLAPIARGESHVLPIQTKEDSNESE